MPASFHKERKAWFQIKHQIVGTYLSLFLGKLGKFGDRVYYVDGFAGQGRLEDGTEGSALIAAKIAAEGWENKSVKLRDVLGEVVNNFKWRTIRVEWIKALRQSQTNGWLQLTGTEDGDMVHFAEKI